MAGCVSDSQQSVDSTQCWEFTAAELFDTVLETEVLYTSHLSMKLSGSIFGTPSREKRIKILSLFLCSLSIKINFKT